MASNAIILHGLFQDYSPSGNSSYVMLPNERLQVPPIIDPDASPIKPSPVCSETTHLTLQQAFPPACSIGNSYSIYPKAKILFLPRSADLPDFPQCTFSLSIQSPKLKSTVILSYYFSLTSQIQFSLNPVNSTLLIFVLLTYSSASPLTLP